MITKQDCIILLTDIGATDKIKEVIKQENPSIEIIKFINDNRELELTKFYEKIRKSYNNKKSKLYINIVKEIEDPNEALITLSALLTQIMIFSKTVPDKAMFLRHSRANEIIAVLNKYLTTYDITASLKLIRIIKTDIKCCESFSKND